MGIDYIRENRWEFDSGEYLDISKMPDDPFLVFQTWLQASIESGSKEPYAMWISTVDEGNRPHSRIVYLRDVFDNSLMFFSNYNSQKGKNLEQNPFMAAGFFWPELHKQVRIEGKVHHAGSEQSDKYFAGRPRKSQLGAWASEQSKTLSGRKELEDNLKKYEQKFDGMDVPRPDNWGGFILVPDYFEFWLGQPSRLHDRIVYKLAENNWSKHRLNP